MNLISNNGVLNGVHHRLAKSRMAAENEPENSKPSKARYRPTCLIETKPQNAQDKGSGLPVRLTAEPKN